MPNLNGRNRLVPNADQFEVDVPATKPDMQEHVTLSWLDGTAETASNILIVSGTQQQTGTFSSAYGAAKDIEVDAGHNRCPINLTREAALAWLAPGGRSAKELFEILGQRRRPYYEHRTAEAA